MRGKSWSVEEERQLRELISQGLGITEISKVMGKPRLCVKAKVYNLGLSVVVAAGSQHRVAATAAATTHATAIQPNLGRDLASTPDLGNGEFVVQLKRDGPLPSLEEKLRVLDAALVALERPGLSMAEISRLNKIILGVKVYQELFVHFVNYRALETELVELRKQLASEKKQQ